MSKKSISILAIILLLITGGIYYWFFYLNTQTVDVAVEPLKPVVFNPLNRQGTPPQNTDRPKTTVKEEVTDTTTPTKIPLLRHLSESPIGGYMASSTASSTIVRYVDRGVGHIFESLSTNQNIDKISNTTIPRVYESVWNRNLSTTILRYMKDTSDVVVNFYAEIRKTSATTATDAVTVTTPYEIKGRFLSPAIKEIAVSPKADRIFTLNIENGVGVGYISNFDESKKIKIFDTPLTQVALQWPEENTLSITTKASGVSAGTLYFSDVKKGGLKKIIGGIMGLTTKTSMDARKVLFSLGGGRVKTAIYNTKDYTTQEVVFKTLADKCVWSKIHIDSLYCAVPTEIPSGLYPDDWYKGTVSFVDQIWYLDSVTGEVRLLANLLNLSNDLIDATDLSLDPKENFLYFINKKDLTLWSLDLSN